MEMNEIIDLIENASSEKIVESIDNIIDNKEVFTEEDKSLIRQKLGSLNLKKNNDYLSSIIDLLHYLKIYDDLITSKLIAELRHSNYYCHLSFLDYVFGFDYNDDVICYFEKVINSKKRLIVRNQVLLMHLLKKSKIEITDPADKLIKNMKRTEDYRAHIRYMNTIMNCSHFDSLNLDTFKTLISISKKKSFGKSVVEKIKEFELVLSHW